MACTVLRQPEAQPSSEAAHAALLLAHVAWNRAAGFGTPDYRPILREFETSNPSLWNELTSSDAEVLIAALARYKQVHHLHGSQAGGRVRNARRQRARRMDWSASELN